jgi:hypothetical protein
VAARALANEALGVLQTSRPPNICAHLSVGTGTPQNVQGSQSWYWSDFLLFENMDVH